ncbi:MAG TPA: elongation factor G [Sphingobacteriaceae bacterium]
MKTFDEKHIKNVVLVGPAKSGKTTLAETMLFEAGIIHRRGTVEDRNTVCDYREIEHERGNSVYATLVHTEWRDFKINVIDTPGLDDFIGEVITAITVCDTVVLVLNAQNGVEVGTELLWDYVDEYRKPTILAVNQLDSDKAGFQETIEQAKAFFGPAVTVMQYPLNPGSGFNAVIDLLKMVMYRFPAGGGKPEKHPIPESEAELAARLHNELVEKAAENDETLMEKYFEKGNLDEDEMREGLKIGMMKHQVFPVFCLSAKNNMGTGRMMGFIDHVAPSSTEVPGLELEDGTEVPCDPAGPPRMFIFKTVAEPHLGRLSFFKVLSGEVEVGMELQNEATGSTERISQLFIADGRNRNPVNQLKAGDIGCTLKLKNSHVNHTLNGKGASGNIRPIAFPTPKTRIALVTTNKQDEEKLGEVLQEIHLEDPTLCVEYNQELKQVILEGQGDLHLSVTRWKLEHLYRMQVAFEKVRIPYRETILRSAVSSYRHKKQSGGAGQFGEVSLKVEPWYEGMPQLTEYQVRDSETIDLPWGGKLVFNNCIVGGVIDARFIPSILKGVMEKMSQGPLTGSYVRDVRVSVYDGKMHPVDSNDISFRIAGMMAFKDAFLQAEPQLLEPIYDLQVKVPADLMGDVMTELQTRRSMIQSMDTEKDQQIIRARAPLAEMDKLLPSLRNLSQGRAKVRSRFSGYAAVPFDLQKRISEEYGKAELAEVH